MRITSALPLAALIAVGILIMGCSSAADGPMDPPGIDAPRIASDAGRIIWGVYRITFDTQSGIVEITPNRGGEFHADVTAFVVPPACFDCVEIIGSQYKPALKQWSIGILLKNPSPITGYDVRGLVYGLGEKYLKNPDGFMTNYLSQDIQFEAFAKDEPNRAFGPGASYDATYVFHFPGGSNWNSIDYIVDASWPGNCKEPVIEDVVFPGSIIDDGAPSTLTVRAFDHLGDAFNVSADFSQIGGSTDEPLYDDGAHGDGYAGDAIFGATGIVADCAPGEYEITIRAVDSGSKQGWNSCRVEVEGMNHDPVISEITASRTTCEKGNDEEYVALSCIADDQDDDELEYLWSCIAGEFSDEHAPSTDWFPPDEVGKFAIGCHVSDGNGGVADGDGGLIRVTQYFVTNPAPAADFVCERVLEDSSFSKSDYNPADVAVVHFWVA